jgi:predicted nucleic acid-binding protein
MSQHCSEVIDCGKLPEGLSTEIVRLDAYFADRKFPPNDQKARNRKVLELFLNEVRVLPWTQDAMWHYARQQHALRSTGKSIGELDLLIGCHALALDAVCVTNNTREFERIEGLKLENWT